MDSKRCPECGHNPATDHLGMKDQLAMKNAEIKALKSQMEGETDGWNEVVHQLEADNKCLQTIVDMFDWWLRDVQYKAPEQLDEWRRGFIHQMNPDARAIREAKEMAVKD